MRKRFYSLKKAVQAVFGETLQVVGYKPVYGGDINQAYQMTLSDGSVFFMKCNGIRNYDFFRAEEEGLEALRAPGVIGVPRPLAVGTDESQGDLLFTDGISAAGKKDSELLGSFRKRAGIASPRRDIRSGVRERGALFWLPVGQLPGGIQTDEYAEGLLDRVFPGLPAAAADADGGEEAGY